MARYTVVSNIKCDGVDYEPGELIELTEAQASDMPWAVRAVPEGKKAATGAVENKP